MKGDRELVNTKTGEIFQPIRLYYRISSKIGVRVALNKIKCIDFEPSENHWVWVYENEAKKIEFEISYDDIHPDDKSLILGIFTIISDDQMCLDVGSIPRAIEAIKFFDKRIKKVVARIEYAAIYNKLPRNRHEFPGFQFDKLFGGIDTETFDEKSEQRHQKLGEAISLGNISAVLDNEVMDLIEGYRVDADEDGLRQLSFQMMLNQAIAIEKMKGNDNAKLSTIVDTLLNFIGKKAAH